MYMIIYQSKMIKKGEILLWMDQIGFFNVLASRTYYFCTGKSVSKDIEHIEERMADFTFFKEGFGRN